MRRRRRSRSPEEVRREGGERVGAGLGQWFDPDPSLAVLAEPGGLAGPAGQLGQQDSWAKKGFWQINLNQKFKFKCYLLS
jgi:hypothetical protein